MAAKLIKSSTQEQEYCTPGVPLAPEPPQSPPRDDEAFGLAVYSALIQIAKAFFRRYVGREPKCHNCGK